MIRLKLLAHPFKLLPVLLLFFLASVLAQAQVPSTTFINETFTRTGTGNSSLIFNYTGKKVNIDLSQNPVHYFEGQSDTGNANWILEYNSSNNTGYLLKLSIDDAPDSGGGPAADDKISRFDCVTGTPTDLCVGAGCGNNDFNGFVNFTISFYSNNNTFSILLGTSTTTRVDGGQLCTNASQIGNVMFAPDNAALPGSRYIVKNNVFLADNRAPNFTGMIPNITMDEDTSYSFNISGNFSDPDGENLAFGSESAGNLTISINQSNGIVNITPTANFSGIRHVRFLANDTKNFTYSNNVTVNVTNVNDIPIVSNVLLNNTDFLNRTNGSLAAGWAFSDIDNDVQQGNETLWYINGTENIAFRNLTIINSSNTTKTQNWTFSVRAFDGANFSEFVNSSTITIGNAVPTQSAPSITSNDEHNRKNGTLACNNQSTNDLDDDVIANFIRWHKNNVLIDTATGSTTLNAGNYSKNDNLTCEMAPFDGAVNGTSLNSTNFTILNAAPLLNNSIQNKIWDEDASTAINLSNLSGGFIDIDGDNLTYNFTPVSDISISINNNTGIASLTPAADFNGLRNVLFFAFDGTNLTSSNNVTLTVNDVAEPSSPSSPSTPSATGSGGGGGGGLAGGKYVCDLDWECDEWSECADGRQTMKCRLIQVPNFISLERCPQFNVPEQERACKTEPLESCHDYVQNHGETGIDCGGPCGACFDIEVKKERNETESLKSENAITGAVIAEPNKLDINYFWLILAVAILFLLLVLYFRFGKRLFRGKSEF